MDAKKVGCIGCIVVVVVVILIVVGFVVAIVISAKRMENVKKAALNSPEREKPYLERRAEFKTKLRRLDKSPQAWELGNLPAHLQLVTYPSGDLNLKAILYVPPNVGNTKQPALVYYHGGFALDDEDLEDCQPFVDDGFIVMMPALRGENGGEGNFELFAGELDDAANAIRWLGKHENVDAVNIYAFGHSIGGGVSAMMSLMDDDLPLKHCGSSGGLYDITTFYGWKYSDGARVVRFNPDDPIECLMRVLWGNVKWMKRKHYAYIGRQDFPFHIAVEEMQEENKTAPDPGRLTITQMDGDHFTSLEPAVRQYFNIVKSGLGTRNFIPGPPDVMTRRPAENTNIQPTPSFPAHPNNGTGTMMPSPPTNLGPPANSIPTNPMPASPVPPNRLGPPGPSNSPGPPNRIAPPGSAPRFEPPPMTRPPMPSRPNFGGPGSN